MTEKNNAGVQPPASEWTDPDDAPELTEEFFADAEVFQGDAFVRRGRGRPPTGKAKELVSLRLDRDVLAKLRKAGSGWQSQVSDLLRLALHMQEMEKTTGSPVAGRRAGQAGLGDAHQQLTAASAANAEDAHTGSSGGDVVELSAGGNGTGTVIGRQQHEED